jgi:MFS superfamily sulfate permease-like transporter
LHWWTLAFGIGAWLLIAGLRRLSPNVPGVLLAVLAATVVSAAIGYEDTARVSPSQIQHAPTVDTIARYADTQARIAKLTQEMTELKRDADRLEAAGGLDNVTEAVTKRARLAVIDYELRTLKHESNQTRVALHAITLHAAQDAAGQPVFFPADTQPRGARPDDKTWRFSQVSGDQIILSAGGAVVGAIPKGLPTFSAPTLHWDLLLALLPAALVMALIGFMEATSISKAIATSTGERVDTSRELIGQGLANIAGSFFGSYTVSGSFSRSAVAARTGAKTGLFAIISALAVVLVLLFFTSYLYHLPQAVLAVIVMMAVFGLIRIAPLVHAWRVDRIGALTGLVTFVATLLMAPAIANGILLGIALTVLHFLIRTMKPRAEVVSRKADGTLGGIRAHQLKPISERFVPVRFDGSLTFVNVAYFEDIILEAHADFPNASTILVVGSGINEVDASGEEKIREVAERLRQVGVTLVFSSLKHQVRRVFEASGLVEDLGRASFFPDKETALEKLCERHATGADGAGHSAATTLSAARPA